MRGDNLPIIDLNKYNTDRKETKYIHINLIVRNLIIKENIKKVEIEFILGTKTLISKTAIYAEFACVKSSMPREDCDSAPDGYKPVFETMIQSMGPCVRR